MRNRPISNVVLVSLIGAFCILTGLLTYVEVSGREVGNLLMVLTVGFPTFVASILAMYRGDQTRDDVKSVADTVDQVAHQTNGPLTAALRSLSAELQALHEKVDKVNPPTGVDRPEDAIPTQRSGTL